MERDLHRSPKIYFLKSLYRVWHFTKIPNNSLFIMLSKNLICVSLKNNLIDQITLYYLLKLINIISNIK